jgi:hypothetical protein
MDIEFTEEQKILQESIERMLRANYDFDKRQEIVASEQGYSRVLWQKFADPGAFWPRPQPRRWAASAADRSPR